MSMVEVAGKLRVNPFAGLPVKTAVRGMEVLLIRACAVSPVIREAANRNPGCGILEAWDTQGRHFKIEITQVGGPE